MLDGAHFHRRIDQAGGPDHLLGEDAAGAPELPGAGRRRDIDRLRAHRVPFLEFQRPVVDAGGQPEAIFGERRLAPEVALIHGAQLRNGDVGFVDEDDGFVGQIFEQGRRRLAGAAPREPARIILDAGAGAGRLDHFEIEHRALFQALRFEKLALAAELIEAQAQFLAHALGGLGQRRARRHIMRIGVNLHRVELGRFPARQRIEFENRIHLVAEQGHAPGAVLVMRRENVDGVAAHAESSRARTPRRCGGIAARPGAPADRRAGMRSPRAIENAMPE